MNSWMRGMFKLEWSRGMGYAYLICYICRIFANCCFLVQCSRTAGLPSSGPGWVNIGTASVGWRTVSPNGVKTLVAADLKGTRERQLAARRHILLNHLTFLQSKITHFPLPSIRQQMKRNDVLKVIVEKYREVYCNLQCLQNWIIFWWF